MADEFDFWDAALDFDGDAFCPSPLGYDDGEGLEPFDGEFSPRAFRLNLKRQSKTIENRNQLVELIKDPPRSGEEIHLVCKDNCSMWDFAPVFIERLGRAKTLYGTSWRVSNYVVSELARLCDAGEIEKTCWIVDKRFRDLEPAICYKLENQAKKTGGWVKTRRTHIKLLLIETEKDKIVVTGSMNMARESKLLELIQTTNDKELFDFYRQFFEEV